MKKSSLLKTIKMLFIVTILLCFTSCSVYTQSDIDNAYEKGREQGYQNGYSDGQSDAEFDGDSFDIMEEAYNNGYDEGYNEGYESGFDSGYDNGKGDYMPEQANDSNLDKYIGNAIKDIADNEKENTTKNNRTESSPNVITPIE